MSTRPDGQSAGVDPSPRSTRWISTSRHRRNGSIDTRCSPPPTVRTGFAQPSFGIVTKSESSRSADESTSATITCAFLVAPASISAVRPPMPPTYCSTVSSRIAAAMRRDIPSAFRAMWDSRCPTVQSGRSDGKPTWSSVRAAIAEPSLTCARRQPSTSILGALTIANYDTACPALATRTGHADISGLFSAIRPSGSGEDYPHILTSDHSGPFEIVRAMGAPAADVLADG